MAMQISTDTCSSDVVTEDVLKLLKSPSFKPTVFLEKYLAEKFCTRLHQLVDENMSANCVVIFSGLLDCVLAVADIDEKFISLYFGAMEFSFYEKMTYILKNKFLENEYNLLLQIKVLKLVSHIISRIPSKKITFTAAGLHNVLLSENPSFVNFEFIHQRIEILESLSDIQNAVQEMSTLQAIEVLCYFLKYFYNDHDTIDDEVKEKVIVKTLNLIGKLIKDCAFNNMNHMKKIDEDFSRLARAFPRLEKTIKDVFQYLNESIPLSSRSVNSSKLSVNMSAMKLSKQRAVVLPHTLSIEDLEPSSNELNSFSQKKIPTDGIYVLDRLKYINTMDPEVNAYSPEKTVEQISLESTAEMICGMLNSNKGGTIHYGIHPTGRIDGIRVNYDARDGFRCGVDNLFLTQILPILPSTLVNIVFIPVRYENRRNIEPNHCLYVIRVIVPSNMNTVYYLKSHNVCYVRRPEGNVRLNLREVRELAVLYCEKRFIQSTPTP